MAPADFEVRSNIREVLADLRGFDRKLATATRRRLRQSGDEAIEEMRQVLAEPPPGGATGVRRGAADRSRSRGSRAGVAASLRTRVVAGTSRQTIRITAAGDAFARSYNLRSWRHPIRHDPATTSPSEVPWVEQPGRPYFGSVITRRWESIRGRVDEALGEALDAIAAHRSTAGPGGPA